MITIIADVASPVELLDQVADRLENTAGLFGFLGDQLADYERDVFATAGFGEWAADDTDTILDKGNARVLVDSGLLLRELTSPQVEGESVKVTSGRATYAQRLRDGSGGRPKRDPVPDPQPARIDAWADGLLGFLLEGHK